MNLTLRLKLKTLQMQSENLSFRQMWNLSFGFFGVQIACALQSANTAPEGVGPEDYAGFHGIELKAQEKKDSEGFISLLIHAQK